MASRQLQGIPLSMEVKTMNLDRFLVRFAFAFGLAVLQSACATTTTSVPLATTPGSTTGPRQQCNNPIKCLQGPQRFPLVILRNRRIRDGRLWGDGGLLEGVVAVCSFCAQLHLTPAHSGLFQPKVGFLAILGWSGPE